MIAELARATTLAAGAECGARGAGRMRAWRVHGYGGVAELRLEAARVPPLRAPDHLLVRVRAASINPIDVAMTRGYGAAALNLARGLGGAAPGEELPLVCGRDLVGEVVRAGPAARLRRGQRVWAALPPYAPGAHAEYALVRDSWAAAAPDTLGDAEAAGAPYAALTAMSALRAAGVESGGSGAEVLVLGLGGVGQAALQLLAARRHRVTVGCAAELGPLARHLGAAEALDRHAPDYERRLVEGGPYAAILDCAGLGGEAAAARRWRFRRYVTLTSPLLRETDARGVVAGTAVAAARLVAQNAPVAACPPRVRWAFVSPSAADLEELRSLADRGRFGVAVEREFPWWEAAAAYERAARGAARGKLVLDFTRPPPPHLATSPRCGSSPPEDSTSTL